MKLSDGNEVKVGDVVWDNNCWDRGIVVKTWDNDLLIFYDKLGLLKQSPEFLQTKKPEALFKYECEYGKVKRTKFTKEFSRGFIEGFNNGLEFMASFNSRDME